MKDLPLQQEFDPVAAHSLLREVQGKGRTLFAWEDEPLTPPVMPAENQGKAEYYRELYAYQASRAIDEFCRVLTSLPIMRGFIELNPKILNVPIYIDDVEEEDFGHYDFESQSISLSPRVFAAFHPEDEEEANEHSVEVRAIKTLAHELRHAWHDVKGIASLPQELSNPPFSGIYRVLNNRVMEADANTFDIAVLYDLAIHADRVGIPAVNLFSDVHEVAPVCMEAYTQSIDEDAMNHWNGGAANECFMAFFSFENDHYLNKYDKKYARFLAKYEPTRIDSWSYPEFLQDKASWNVFCQHVRRFGCLVSCEDNGDQIVFKNYLSTHALELKRASVAGGLTPTVLQDCGCTIGRDLRPDPVEAPFIEV